jgi:hypothetical protein
MVLHLASLAGGTANGLRESRERFRWSSERRRKRHPIRFVGASHGPPASSADYSIEPPIRLAGVREGFDILVMRRPHGRQTHRLLGTNTTKGGFCPTLSPRSYARCDDDLPAAPFPRRAERGSRKARRKHFEHHNRRDKWPTDERALAIGYCRAGKDSGITDDGLLATYIKMTPSGGLFGGPAGCAGFSSPAWRGMDIHGVGRWSNGTPHSSRIVRNFRYEGSESETSKPVIIGAISPLCHPWETPAFSNTFRNAPAYLIDSSIGWKRTRILRPDPVSFSKRHFSCCGLMKRATTWL